MGRWSDRAEELLYDGETVDEKFEIGTAAVVVTSHRVLAFTPDSDGSNFQQADRPNVTGVTIGGDSESKFLRLGARAAVYGIILLIAGFLLPIDDVLTGVALPETTGQLGIGGVLGLFQRMLTLLRNLDNIMRLFGALLLVFSVVPFGVYLWSRDRMLVIDVAGEEESSLTVQAPETDDDAVAEQLEATILPAGVESESDSRLESLLG